MRDWDFHTDGIPYSFYNLLTSRGCLGPPEGIDEIYHQLHYMADDITEDNMMYIFSLYDNFYAEKRIICYNPLSIVTFPFFLAHSEIVALMQKTKKEIKNLYKRGYDNICLRI